MTGARAYRVRTRADVAPVHPRAILRPDVSAVKRGHRVMALLAGGGYAEKVVIHERMVPHHAVASRPRRTTPAAPTQQAAPSFALP